MTSVGSQFLFGFNVAKGLRRARADKLRPTGTSNLACRQSFPSPLQLLRVAGIFENESKRTGSDVVATPTRQQKGEDQGKERRGDLEAR